MRVITLVLFIFFAAPSGAQGLHTSEELGRDLGLPKEVAVKMASSLNELNRARQHNSQQPGRFWEHKAKYLEAYILLQIPLSHAVDLDREVRSKIKGKPGEPLPAELVKRLEAFKVVFEVLQGDLKKVLEKADIYRSALMKEKCALESETCAAEVSRALEDLKPIYRIEAAMRVKNPLIALLERGAL